MRGPGTAVRFDGVPVNEKKETDMKRPVLKTQLGFASYAVLLILALTASNASAERVCERPRSETGRTCTIETCVVLQAVVTNRCKNANEPTDCRELLANDCDGFRRARGEWQTCQAARININNTCWNGGDKDHRDRVALDQEEINVCSLRLAVECGEPCP